MTVSAVKRQVKQTAKAEEQQREIKEAAGMFYFFSSPNIHTENLIARLNVKKPSKKRAMSPLSQPLKKKMKGSVVLIFDTTHLPSLLL